MVDVICSKNLPIGTRRLVDLLKQTIETDQFNPFAGIIYSRTGVIQNDPNGILTPKEVLEMNWLAENVIGEIPPARALSDQAQPVLAAQGIHSVL